MSKLINKRIVLPVCVCCLCAPCVLLASPGELDEITIRVIDNDAILPGSHALALPVNEDIQEHNQNSRLESKETERAGKSSAEHEDNDKTDELKKDAEHFGQHEKSERHDELEHPEQPERPEEMEQPEQPEEHEAPEIETPEQPEQPAELEQSDDHEETEHREYSGEH
jgi:hypothetical protein